VKSCHRGEVCMKALWVARWLLHRPCYGRGGRAGAGALRESRFENGDSTARPSTAIRNSRFKIQDACCSDAENLCTTQTFLQMVVGRVGRAEGRSALRDGEGVLAGVFEADSQGGCTFRTILMAPAQRLQA